MPIPLFGQGYGSVSGTVLDATGAAITRATVTITRTDTGHQSTVSTNGSGNYVFSSLPAGHYSLKIAAPGFRTFEQSNVIVETNQSVNVSTTLKVAARTDTVQVEAARPGIYAATDSSSATRTDTPLIEIPQSVQVINRNLVEEQDVRTLAGALLSVSGVTPSHPEEDLFLTPIVRGFPAEIYLDGLAMFGSTQTANDPTSLVGIERIDVLKGPSSALYGGGLGSPLGGLINIESERPEKKVSGFVAMRGGSYSTRDPYADFSVPLGHGAAARITAEYQTIGSWIDQLGGDRWFAQPSVSFQLDPKTDLLVQGQFNHTGQLDYTGLPAALALGGELDRNAFPGAPIGQPHTRIDNRLGTVEFRHEFSDTLRLSATGRYYDSELSEYGSFADPALAPPDPATPTTFPILPVDLITTMKEGTSDVNLLANVHMLGGRHELLVGTDYDHINFFSGMGFSGITVGSIDLANPVYNLSYGAVTPINFTQTDRYETIATYAQDQATYGRLHLTGSLRYTRLNFREREQLTDATYNHVSPRVGATFDLVHGVAAYAGYATAFRGAFGFIGLQPPKPETSRNVEGGVKLALPKAGLSSTIAVFDQTRDNVATPDLTNPLFSIQTGQQRAPGFETDLMWEHGRAFSVLANYAYTDAKVTQDNLIPIGDKLARVPKNSGRIAAHYRILNGPAKGLSFGMGVTAFDRRELTLPNTFAVPGYAAVDAQAAYDFGRYTIEGSAVNLGDRRTFDPYEYFGFPVVMPNQPLSAYVTLKIHFKE